VNIPSRSERQHLNPLRTIAWLFDELVRVPGTNIRFGLDALIGLLPGGGDLVGGAVAAYALVVAGRLGAPTSVLLRMALNVLVDSLLGVIPVVGDLFDVQWKANRKNVQLLERYLAEPRKATRASRFVVAGIVAVLVITLIGIAIGTVWLIRLIIHSVT
jgi:hypothetical protein